MASFSFLSFLSSSHCLVYGSMDEDALTLTAIDGREILKAGVFLTWVPNMAFWVCVDDNITDEAHAIDAMVGFCVTMERV